MRNGLFIFGFALLAGAARAQNEPPLQTAHTATGVVLRVEGSVVVLGMGDARREVLVAVVPETVLTAEGAAVKLAEVQAGLAAVVEQEFGVTRRVEFHKGREGKRGRE